MATLYLTEQNTTLHKEQNRLVVKYQDTVLASIHEFKVERVVVVGNAQLTTQVMSFLLDHGIDTVFLSIHGKLKGRLVPLESKNVLLRVAQFERFRSPDFAIGLAREVVMAKIANSARVLSRYQRNHPEAKFSEALTALESMLRQAGRTGTLDALRGVEGQAAAIYFQVFGGMLRNGLTFEKRTRRPPKDPVNAILSFGYTLLYQEAISATASVGFDPYVGFFHGVDYGRCSLALDLIEEFRAMTIDRLTTNVFNLGVVSTKDFVKSDEGGVLLDSPGRKRFLGEYERLMTTEFTNPSNGQHTSFRKALHEQALALQRVVLQNQKYTPFQEWH